MADVQLADGGEFMPYFLAHVEPVYPNVRATKATIEELTWSDGPTEISFVDAPKSFQDLSTTLLVFGDDLAAGSSLLILQDFCFAPAYPIALTVAMMLDDLRLVIRSPARAPQRSSWNERCRLRWSPTRGNTGHSATRSSRTAGARSSP